jgi:hypothetical protein
MQPMGGQHCLQHLGRKVLQGVLAKADGRLSGKTFFDHLFVPDDLLAFFFISRRPGKISGAPEAGKPILRASIDCLLQHPHHPVRFEPSVGEIYFFFAVDLQRAALDFLFWTEPQKSQVIEESFRDGAPLHTEAALALSKAIGYEGRKDAHQCIV